LNLGWVGIALLTALILSGYWRSVALLREGRQAAAFWFAACVIAVVYNFSEASFKELNPMWEFLLLAIMTVRTLPQVEAVAAAVPAPVRPVRAFDPSRKISGRFDHFRPRNAG